jgi:hypothetical protein
MRINLFTAPAIGLYLNKLRREGRVKDVETFMNCVDKDFRKQWKAYDKLYFESERFSQTEFAGIFNIVCIDGGFIALDIIQTILNIGEATESLIGCVKKGVKETSKK